MVLSSKSIIIKANQIKIVKVAAILNSFFCSYLLRYSTYSTLKNDKNEQIEKCML